MCQHYEKLQFEFFCKENLHFLCEVMLSHLSMTTVIIFILFF